MLNLNQMGNVFLTLLLGLGMIFATASSVLAATDCQGSSRSCVSPAVCQASQGTARVVPATQCSELSSQTGNALVCCEVSDDFKSTITPPPAAANNNTHLCGDGRGVQTAIGCLMAGNPKQLVAQLWGWGASVGGGVAFLMILYAGLQMTMAAGDPKKIQAARELIMAALGGLLIIVLSVILLNFIGVSVLGLNRFGFSL